jgi:hypothetical protein
MNSRPDELEPDAFDERDDGAEAPVEGPHEERQHDELPQGDDGPS